MNQHEHTQEATELVRRAQEESTNGGNERIAAELLWGAFAHCLIAVAQNDGLPHDSHGAFRTIARHMDATQDSNDWRSRLGQPRISITPSITATCQPKNCEPTDAGLERPPWSS